MYVSQGDRTYSRELVELFWEGSVGRIDNFKGMTLVERGKQKQTKRWNVDRGHRAELEAFFGALRHGQGLPVPFHDYVYTTPGDLLHRGVYQSGYTRGRGPRPVWPGVACNVNVVILASSFPPEVRSLSTLMYELAVDLVGHGHRVSVITGIPRYTLPEGAEKRYRRKLFVRETIDGVSVLRLPMLSFPRRVPLARGLEHFVIALQYLLGGLVKGPQTVALGVFASAAAGPLRVLDQAHLSVPVCVQRAGHLPTGRHRPGSAQEPPPHSYGGSHGAVYLPPRCSHHGSFRGEPGPADRQGRSPRETDRDLELGGY